MFEMCWVQLLENLSEIILKTPEIHVGKHKHVYKHRTLPWWNEECEEAVKLHKKTFYRLKRHKTSENILEIRKQRARMRFILKKKRRETWKKFLSVLVVQHL